MSRQGSSLLVTSSGIASTSAAAAAQDASRVPAHQIEMSQNADGMRVITGRHYVDAAADDPRLSGTTRGAARECYVFHRLKRTAHGADF